MSKKIHKGKISTEVEFSTQQMLGIILSGLIATEPSLTEEEREELEELTGLLNYISKLSFKHSSKGIAADYTVAATNNEEGNKIRDRFNELVRLPLVREIVIQILLPPPTTKKTNIRRSGHYNDQLLKNDYPAERKGNQLQLWDGLSDKMKKEIEEVGIEKEEAIQRVVEGIRLTSTETRLMDAILQLLHERSETKPESKNYYTGNIKAPLVPYGEEKVVAPRLFFTEYELAKYYKGGGSVSGKIVENVRETLIGLSNKHFAINYSRRAKLKDGRGVMEKIQRFAKIIEIMSHEVEIEGTDKVASSKENKIIIQLHPIFRDNIETKYIEYPSDITRRTEIAYGSTHISKETLRLRDFLMSQRSGKEWTTSIYLEKLYHKLADREMKSFKRTRVAERTKKALETMKTLGLLKEYREDIGKTGERLVILELDKDWT